MVKFQAETFPDLFRQVVTSRPDHVAVAGPDLTITYRELEQRTADMARALVAQGAGKGTRIGILAPSSPLWVTAYYAALRIGALVTSMNTLSTPIELAHIVRYSDVQMIVGSRRFMRHDYAATLREALEISDDEVPGRLRLSSAPYLRSVWFDDADGMPWANPVDSLISAANGECSVDHALLTDIEREVSPSDDAVVIFTSGTTALPKAVVHTQRTVASKPFVMLHAGGKFDPEPEDCVLSLMPPFWVGGQMTALTTLAAGATLVLVPSLEPTVVAEAIVGCGVTKAIGVIPGDPKYIEAVNALAGQGHAESVDGLASPKLNGGQVTRRVPGSIGAGNMGMSEAFGWHTAESVRSADYAAHPGTVGRPLGGFEQRIVDPDTGLDVPAGSPGELWLRGGSLMSGYYKVDRDDVFTADGYFRTKDRVQMDDDGFLYFLGRLSDMIKTRGANVSRLEVQAALEALPDVDVALAVGLPDDQLGEAVAAAVVRSAGSAATESDIRTAVRERLSSYKVPRHIVFIDKGDVPMTTSGKLELRSLTALISSRLSATQSA